jgi:hypothetical protein
MMHPVDWTIISSAAIAFMAFFLLQMIVFRMMHQEAVFKAILIIFAITSVLHLSGLSLALSVGRDFADADAMTKAVIIVFSYLIFTMTAFVYILCVFGPSETSIRVRVARELMEGPDHGLSQAELLGRYNAKMILKRRIERLMLAGDIIEREGKYSLIKKANFFFFIDTVANAIHGFIKSK